MLHLLPAEGPLLLDGSPVLFARLEAGDKLFLAFAGLVQMAVGGFVVYIRLQSV